MQLSGSIYIYMNMDEYGSTDAYNLSSKSSVLCFTLHVTKELDPCKAFSGESEEDPEAIFVQIGVAWSGGMGPGGMDVKQKKNHQGFVDW